MGEFPGEYPSDCGRFRIKTWRGQSGRVIVKVWPVGDFVRRLMSQNLGLLPTVTTCGSVAEIDAQVGRIVASYEAPDK